jgi:hypothetical protein
MLRRASDAARCVTFFRERFRIHPWASLWAREVMLFRERFRINPWTSCEMVTLFRESRISDKSENCASNCLDCKSLRLRWQHAPNIIANSSQSVLRLAPGSTTLCTPHSQKHCKYVDKSRVHVFKRLLASSGGAYAVYKIDFQPTNSQWSTPRNNRENSLNWHILLLQFVWFPSGPQ